MRQSQVIQRTSAVPSTHVSKVLSTPTCGLRVVDVVAWALVRW
jgi:hypothetical protein